MVSEFHLEWLQSVSEKELEEETSSEEEIGLELEEEEEGLEEDEEELNLEEEGEEIDGVEEMTEETGEEEPVFCVLQETRAQARRTNRSDFVFLI